MDKTRLKFCPNCAEVGCTDDKFLKYHIKGYKATYNSNDIIKCTDCNHDLIDCGITCDDYVTITHISLDSNFLKSMIDLYKTNVIEYQLKMSQFKANLSQQESVPKKTTNKVTCPYCQSTNTKKIDGTERIASVAMLGIFSKKINKSFKCRECGGTF